MNAKTCFVGAPLGRTRMQVQPSLNQSAFVSSRQVPLFRTAAQRRNRLSMGLFGLGFPELAVIAGVGIFIFGPSKIAELGKDLGGLAGGVKKASSEFREAMQESMEEADREMERKQLEKDSVADAKVVDKTPGKSEG